jgi:murein DD-endopeptidase MepM/ murein hydrolase activator NlpD
MPARTGACRGGKGIRIIDRSRSATLHPIRTLRTMLALAAIAAGLVAAPAAMASPMPQYMPGSTPGAAPEGPGAAPPPVATAPAPVATTPVTPPLSISPGARGAQVRTLQRKLRVRGIRVPVDGTYGARTRAGVRVLQRKFRMKPTGIADAKLLQRLGIKVRAVASTPVALSAPATTTARYLKVFPVLGKYSYSNDFGHARHQGSHEGNDIIGVIGQPLVSCVDGTISRLTRTETGLGGIYIWIVDAEGNSYYYAHMHTIAPELKAGSRVTAGQPVGTMGMTGDARGTIPHLHFEIRPKGGGSINPYSDLRAVDPNK